MIANDINGETYEIYPPNQPPAGSAFTSIVLSFDDVMHPNFFEWFFDRIAPRLVKKSSIYPKEFP